MDRTPEDIFKEKIELLEKAETSMNSEVIKLQRAMYDLIIDEYLPQFDTKDGVVLNTDKNNRLINSIDNIFDKLQKNMQRDVLGVFVKSILESANLSAEYYEALGFKKTVVSDLLKNKVKLEERLGITPTGRLKKDGYLFRLGQTTQVRDELKTYVLNGLINSDTSFLDFQLGFRNLVIGNKRQKGLATTGRLQRYFDQFAYDAFNSVDAATNKQLATNLGLNHLLYGGSLIDTSRRFCEKRAGRAFTIAETKKWKNDPDLIDKKTKNTYRPLIERGRYRCRHWIRYITETVYLSYEKRGLTGLAA